ncbi:hypothetical protein Tco_1342149 [Tanacetum coccineum]
MTYPPLRLEGLPFELKRDLLPIIPRNLRIVASGVESSSRWLPVWESVTRRPTPSRLSSAWQFSIHPQALRFPSKPDRAHICIINKC